MRNPKARKGYLFTQSDTTTTTAVFAKCETADANTLCYCCYLYGDLLSLTGHFPPSRLQEIAQNQQQQPLFNTCVVVAAHDDDDDDDGGGERDNFFHLPVRFNLAAN